MKDKLMKACVLVLIVFSIDNLLKDQEQEQEQTVIHEIIVIEIPTIIENKSPHVTIIADEQLVVEDVDLFCLAKNVFHEAGIETDMGKYAVAQVTLNRVKSKKYPNTICKVVLQRYQFSWANQKSKHWTHPKGINWDRSKAIAKRVIYENHRVKGLEHSEYYHADYVSPHWSRKMTPVATVGRHIFYTNRPVY
tara:strand:+ start:6939 stop:7517 length:579 start_codon:yes stop_codon:yes gene_type:complete